MGKPDPIINAPPLLLSRERVASALGISESTIERLVHSGQLPPPRRISGNRIGWLWRELQAFAEGLPVSDIDPGPGRRTETV